MDVFAALEERIDRLVQAYQQGQQRIAELEAENAKSSGGGDEVEGLTGRVDELEAERAELRTRLEKVLATLNKLEL